MVRVRFAPSPTGDPHVGSAWTALFNWLFARHTQGKLILRIEDTDQARLVPESLGHIYELLDWLGLEPDEGPREGGNFGPYIQSERLALYREHAELLLASNTAYRCFCTPERLSQLRTEQQERGDPPMYDRKCRAIPADESSHRAQTEPFVIRLTVPDGVTTAQDIVRGTIEWSNATIDDAVLVKSDGFPTYHLANVVDDHAMEISHVIRAEEWLPSLPKHLILYAAFGWTPPVFAHLPLILGPDKKKLSKRHGHTAALEFRRDYLPDAFINFLALLGWRPPKSDQEIFSRQELIRLFDLVDVRPSGAVFDQQKLNALNADWMRQYPEVVASALKRDIPNLSTTILLLALERSSTLSDVAASYKRIVEPPPLDPALLVPGGEDAAEVRAVLQAVLSALRKISMWSKEEIEAVLNRAMHDLGKPSKSVHWPFRIALSHENPSPGGSNVAAAIGNDETLRRLDFAIRGLS